MGTGREHLITEDRPMRRMLLGLAMLTALAVLGVNAAAAADVGAGGSSDYQITKQHGPYLILVGSFVGDEAQDMATRLTAELRKDYKLQAYIFSKSEQERAERDRLLEEWKRQNGGAPARKVRITDEYTVLVGHYKNMDAAYDDLGRIKKLKPPSSVPAGPGLFTAKLEYKKNMDNWLDGGKIQKGGLVSQFSRAFVVRNPLLPADKPVAGASGTLDDEESVLLNLNASEKHSLMKCKGKWTLLVSVRGGGAITQSSKPSVFDDLNPWSPKPGTPQQLSSKSNSQNHTADARGLAEVLRDNKFGYEAYVLHTRGASFVTVGGFNAPNDPEMLRLHRQLAGMTVGNTKLMDTPMPMPVPRP
jgi:hypothetical protein